MCTKGIDDIKMSCVVQKILNLDLSILSKYEENVI